VINKFTNPLPMSFADLNDDILAFGFRDDYVTGKA
jgi:hypothetical protein